MNELGKVIEQIPEENRIVYRLTVGLDTDGDVTVCTNANPVSQMIFAHITSEKLLSMLQLQMDVACRDAVTLIQSHDRVSSCINVAELKRQARGECHER